jgi:hypothetical protein
MQNASTPSQELKADTKNQDLHMAGMCMDRIQYAEQLNKKNWPGGLECKMPWVT